MHLAGDSEPEPDIAVVRGAPRDYTTAHPTTAVLAVEIAVTTLAYARDVKGPLYARANVPDFSHVNVPGRRVTVFRQPRTDPTSVSGWIYGESGVYLPGDRVAPLDKPDRQLAVAELFYAHG